MAESEMSRAALISKGPFADGTNNTGELRFTTAAATSVNAIPGSWSGKFVELYNESGTAAELVAFVFSNSSTQTCTIGAAAANGGAATDRGRIIAPGQRLKIRLPSPRGPQVGVGTQFNLFFARISASGTPTISMSLVE